MTSVAASFFASPAMPASIAAADTAVADGRLFGQAVQFVPAATATAMPLAMPLPGMMLASIDLAATAPIVPAAPGGVPMPDGPPPAPSEAATAASPATAAPPETAAIPFRAIPTTPEPAPAISDGPAPDRPANQPSTVKGDPLRPAIPSSTETDDSDEADMVASPYAADRTADAPVPVTKPATPAVDRTPIATQPPRTEGVVQAPTAEAATMPTAMSTVAKSVVRPRDGKTSPARERASDTGAPPSSPNTAAMSSPPILAVPNTPAEVRPDAEVAGAAAGSMPNVRGARAVRKAEAGSEASDTDTPAATAIDPALATAIAGVALSPTPERATPAPASQGDPAPTVTISRTTAPPAMDDTLPERFAPDRQDATTAGETPVSDRPPHPGPTDPAVTTPSRGFTLLAIASLPQAPAVAATPPLAAATQAPVVAAVPGRIGHETGVAIARHVAAESGGDMIVVRLDPVEMGRIEVTLRFDDKGTLRAVVAADNPVALDLLRRDSADLGRALADAGVRADAQTLRFDTRAGTDAGGQGGQPWQRQQEPRARAAERDYPAGAEQAAAYQPLRTRGRVDLMA